MAKPHKAKVAMVSALGLSHAEAVASQHGGIFPDTEEGLRALPGIGDYISKILLYMAVFGIIFEMPIVSFLLARLGIVQAAMLRQYRRYAIVVGCILAAVITPTADPFNFALVAVPLVILYEVSIVVVRVSQRRADLGNDPTFTKPN